MIESAAAWGAGCALSWGVSDIVARFAGRSVGVLVATCTMMTIGAALIAAAMAATGEPFEWRLDGIHWLIGIGAGTVLGSILFYHAVTHGPVSLASPVVACYPAIAVPISVALGARPDPVHWVAMIATMAGVWLVARATPTGEGAAPEYAPRRGAANDPLLPDRRRDLRRLPHRCRPGHRDLWAPGRPF